MQSWPHSEGTVKKMTRIPPSIVMGHDNNEEASDIANSSYCSDLADSGSYLRGANDDDDDASHYTSITLHLQSAAVKAVAHVKSHRALNAAVPLEVKEAMLEREFPHVAGTERPDEVFASEAGEDKHPYITEGGQSYNDCIKTLSVSEVLHLRQAMYTFEKHRMLSTMHQLSTQMYAYQDLLEENQRLKQEIIQVKGVKDDTISELENSIIDMKLELASSKSTEDHHRLRIAKLEFDLKKLYAMHQRFGTPTDEETHQNSRRSSDITQSSTTAAQPHYNIRLGEQIPTKNPLLTRSWSEHQRNLKSAFPILDGSFIKDVVDKVAGLSPVVDKATFTCEHVESRERHGSANEADDELVIWGSRKAKKFSDSASRHHKSLKPMGRAESVADAALWGSKKPDEFTDGGPRQLLPTSLRKSRTSREPVGSGDEYNIDYNIPRDYMIK